MRVAGQPDGYGGCVGRKMIRCSIQRVTGRNKPTKADTAPIARKILTGTHEGVDIPEYAPAETQVEHGLGDALGFH
ncbi:MAG: hypothetical protein NVS1B5_20330 [Gemmatimonadaceae bacterium]